LVSKFVADNFINLILLLNSFESGNYEQALIESFIKFDELLKVEKINNFLKRDNYMIKKEFDFDLEFKKNEKEKTAIILDNDNESNNNNNETTLKKKEIEENLIFEIDDDYSIKKNKDIIITSKKIKELKSARKDSFTLEIDDLKYELNKIKNSQEKSNSLSSNNSRNIENHKEILDFLNFDNDNNTDNLKNKNYSKTNENESKPYKTKEFSNDSSTLTNITRANSLISNKISSNLNTDVNDNYNEITKKAQNFNELISEKMGTTANIALITNNYIYIANVGDSLAVMYKNGKAEKLNQEHKISLNSEISRIRNSGSKIINNRIEGRLNLTRAIGNII